MKIRLHKETRVPHMTHEETWMHEGREAARMAVCNQIDQERGRGGGRLSALALALVFIRGVSWRSTTRAIRVRKECFEKFYLAAYGHAS